MNGKNAFESLKDALRIEALTEREKALKDKVERMKQDITALHGKLDTLGERIGRKSDVDQVALQSLIDSVRTSSEQYVRASELLCESRIMIEERRTKDWLGYALLLFGGILLGAQIYVMRMKNYGWGPNAVRIVVITLVIVMSAFLVLIGYSEKQITPVIGLFGTIVGYLLGKYDRKDEPST